jgi:NADH dehydrogenase FAD-containing subunit
MSPTIVVVGIGFGVCRSLSSIRATDKALASASITSITSKQYHHGNISYLDRRFHAMEQLTSGSVAAPV